MIQSIFFDFNGVIIDDELIQMNAYKHVLKEHSIDLTEEWYFDALGMDDKTFVRAMFERANKATSASVLEAVLTAKTELHRKMIEAELPLFPGVLSFLKGASRQFSLGLVSMANSAEIGYVFERAKLAPLFTVLVMAENVSLCKPAPDCYRRGLEKLNEKRQGERLLPLLPHECLAIEDSPPGIQSARVAGMHTLGITNTVSADALRSAGAEVVTQSLADWTTDAVKLVFDDNH
ncbi:MAG TPA: HAD family phosphatase [Pyrinomonadaceae bacterium]|jgi:phosphoglycolate phosphatase/beta-phosphoglucomutase|nr:HAD family phosphatase [Pyrinomonadaceae bacterium]